MERYRERRRFRIGASRSYEEAIMSDPNGMLSLEEAERRAREGADQLEDIINWVDKTPDKKDDERYVKLTSLFMSLFAEKYGIAAPDYARRDIDRE